ncbi:TetR/AcrR family transcriptional regulator [Streptomyces hoynatensis]|uniref:TetR family transcriptional regulator n=1 Tax=Streptomyces hoynatensis TaxID=1141874 RepID=A0A3A9Z2F7_9ACTN|nr:TetR/AcrR family transcriptional regulator [Streptomyces hoynatensis]RKN42219.1 TetR family transcriptional regulator [Streptomyces hoynatensis]
MSRQRGTRARGHLTAADWAEAALAAMREGGGLAAIAIEPIAARLGATKGSFYWHFANRDALIEAALARWETLRTEEVLAQLQLATDPMTRIRELFQQVTAAVAEDPTEIALLAQAGHPVAGPVLRRVTQRRLDYLAGLFGELGLPEAEARQRSLQAYCGYLGRAQLAHAMPEVLPTGEENARYLDAVIASLLGRRSRPGG